jgi:hypothetical protein
MTAVALLVFEELQLARSSPARLRLASKEKRVYLCRLVSCLLLLLCHMLIAPSFLYNWGKEYDRHDVPENLLVLLAAHLCTTSDENGCVEVPENLLKIWGKGVPGVSFMDADA